MTTTPEPRGGADAPAARAAAVLARHPGTRERVAAALAAPRPAARTGLAGAFCAALGLLAGALATGGAMLVRLAEGGAVVGVIGLALFAGGLALVARAPENRPSLLAWALLFGGDLMALCASHAIVVGRDPVAPIAFAALGVALAQAALMAWAAWRVPAWRRSPPFFLAFATLVVDGALLFALFRFLDDVLRRAPMGVHCVLAAAAQALFAAAVFGMYRDKALRFLVVAVFCCLATVGLAGLTRHGGAGVAAAFAAVVVVETLALAALAWRWAGRDWAAPLVWALAPTLCAQVFWLDFWRWEELRPGPWAGAEAAVAALAAVALTAATAWREGIRRATAAVVFLAAAFLFVAFVVSPGVAWAVALLALGRAQADRALTACGYLALLWAVPFYYYSLRLPLDAKGFLLLGSGAALLAGRWLLCRKGDAR